MTLATPAKRGASGVGLLLASVFGDGSEVVGEGLIVTSNWNPEHSGWAIGRSYWTYGEALIPWDDLDQIGVCDSPAQLMEDYGHFITDSPHDLCVFFVHVAKNPGERGGWRWHKWGSYRGRGEPRCEYLADEPAFDDGVFTFHIYEVTEAR